MNFWAVSFSEDTFPEDLYETGLTLVDPESQTRIKRFYRKNDSYRCLLGRLLPRLLLKEHEIAPKEADFGYSSSGKPYVKNHRLEHSIGFNVSHDNEYVVMAFQTLHESGPQTYDNGLNITSIGVDVMRVALPRYEKTLGSFVQSISDTLTPHERRTLLDNAENNDALGRLYLVWTLKEAYTKALGLGLGFDFKRIEVDTRAGRVSVDGKPPLGWEFTAFTLGSSLGYEYQVAVARFTGLAASEAPGISGHVDVRGRVDGNMDAVAWFRHYDADSFIRRAAEEQ